MQNFLGKKAFGLLELLVSVAVLAIIMLAVSSMMSSSVKQLSANEVRDSMSAIELRINRSIFDGRTLYWSGDEGSGIPGGVNAELKNCVLDDDVVCGVAAFGAVLVPFLELTDGTYLLDRLAGYGVTRAGGDDTLRVLYSRKGSLCAVGAAPSRECPIEAEVELQCADATGCGTLERATKIKVTATVSIVWSGEGVPESIKPKSRTAVIELGRLPKISYEPDDCRLSPYIAAGDQHSCGILSDSSVKCWGSNASGQAPATRAGIYKQVVTGSVHTCAIMGDETVQCWGLNASGQAPATRAGRYRQLTAGLAHTCGIMYDDSVQCWGANAQAQAPATRAGKYRQISAGQVHTCGIMRDYSIQCWGANASGQAPATRTGIFKNITSGGLHSCASLRSGTVECWGLNASSQAPPTRVGFHVLMGKGSGGGSSHNCAVMDNGDIECWGLNTSSQAPATRSAPASGYEQLATGAAYSCSLLGNQTAACWGLNTNSQAPPSVAGPFAVCTKYDENIAEIAGTSFPGTLGQTRRPDIQAGNSVTCYLNAAGDVYCWDLFSTSPVPELLGLSSAGTPMQAYGVYTGFAADLLEMGPERACARREADKKFYCWGGGTLGDGTTTIRNRVPQPVAVSGPVLTVVNLPTCGCAVLDTATRPVYCWGPTVATPTLIAGIDNVVGATATIGNEFYFLSLDGTIHSVAGCGGAFTAGTASPSAEPGSWGLSMGAPWSTVYGLDPTQIQYDNAGVATLNNTGRSVLDIRNNHFHTAKFHYCSSFSGGTYDCYLAGAAVTLPWTANTDNVVVEPAYSGGALRNCILRSDDTVHCYLWGTQDLAKVAYPYVTGVPRQEYPWLTPTPPPVASNTYCWGKNNVGQLGTGTTANSSVPVSVELPLNADEISSGKMHACAALINGTAYCWGLNAEGELGAGTSTGYETYPSPVANGYTNWQDMSGGWTNSCGLRSDGTIYCWGENTLGQLGTGNTTNSNTPQLVVGGFSDWTNLSSLGVQSCGLRSGRAYCWGQNNFGQLGDGTTTSTTSPVQVNGGLTTWIDISNSVSSTCGIRNNTGNYEAYCWGTGNQGEMGNGTTDLINSTPKLVSGGYVDWLQISNGDYHNCGLRSTGSIYCWGYNAYGQLGNGSTADATTPQLVSGGISDWIEVNSGQMHTCARRWDGRIYCWGQNDAGKLGNGSTADANTPQLVSGGFTDWLEVSAGTEMTCARRSGSAPTATPTPVGVTPPPPTSTPTPTPTPTPDCWRECTWEGHACDQGSGCVGPKCYQAGSAEAIAAGCTLQHQCDGECVGSSWCDYYDPVKCPFPMCWVPGVGPSLACPGPGPTPMPTIIIAPNTGCLKKCYPSDGMMCEFPDPLNPSACPAPMCYPAGSPSALAAGCVPIFGSCGVQCIDGQACEVYNSLTCPFPVCYVDWHPAAQYCRFHPCDSWALGYLNTTDWTCDTTVMRATAPPFGQGGVTTSTIVLDQPNAVKAGAPSSLSLIVDGIAAPLICSPLAPIDFTLPAPVVCGGVPPISIIGPCTGIPNSYKCTFTMPAGVATGVPVDIKWNTPTPTVIPNGIRSCGMIGC